MPGHGVTLSSSEERGLQFLNHFTKTSEANTTPISMGRSKRHGLFRRDVPAPHIGGTPGTTEKNINASEVRLTGQVSTSMYESS